METPSPVADLRPLSPRTTLLRSLGRWLLAGLLIGFPIAAILAPQWRIELMVGYLLLGACYRSPLIICCSLGILCAFPDARQSYAPPIQIATTADMLIALGFLVDAGIRRQTGDLLAKTLFAMGLLIALPAAVTVVDAVFEDYPRPIGLGPEALIILIPAFGVLHAHMLANSAAKRPTDGIDRPDRDHLQPSS